MSNFALLFTSTKVHIFIGKYPFFSKNSVWCNFYMIFNIS